MPSQVLSTSTSTSQVDMMASMTGSYFNLLKFTECSLNVATAMFIYPWLLYKSLLLFRLFQVLPFQISSA